MTQQDLMKMADARIEAAMDFFKDDDNHMGLFSAFIGTNFWRLEAYPGAGHNYYYIQDAIYRYHALHPLDEIDKYYYETLIKLAKYLSNEVEAITFFNIVSAELENESNRKSPLHLDFDNLFRVFVDNLLADEELQNDKAAIAKVLEYHKFIGEKYGHVVIPEDVLKQINCIN